LGERKILSVAQKAHKLAAALQALSFWIIAGATKLIAKLEHQASRALYNFGTTASFRA